VTVKFESSVIFVKDIDVSRRFYEDLLEQKVAMDFGPNVGFESGFALWQVDHAYEMVFGAPANDPAPLGCKNIELYFETDALDDMLARVTEAQVTLVHPTYEQPWGQRAFRVYDPDGHIVELGEPMPVVVNRMLASGMSMEETAQRTGMSLEVVHAMAQAAGDKA
jgi:catechol 2,3-dioxygenase-like lactoylglutathione lyase family enzyme